MSVCLLARQLIILMASDEGTDDTERDGGKKKRHYAPQKFLAKYQQQWPCLRPSKVLNHAFCTVCNYDFDVSHQGAAGRLLRLIILT